jgi:hypothetical protein
MMWLPQRPAPESASLTQDKLPEELSCERIHQEKCNGNRECKEATGNAVGYTGAASCKAPALR